MALMTSIDGGGGGSTLDAQNAMFACRHAVLRPGVDRKLISRVCERLNRSRSPIAHSLLACCQHVAGDGGAATPAASAGGKVLLIMLLHIMPHRAATFKAFCAASNACMQGRIGLLKCSSRMSC